MDNYFILLDKKEAITSRKAMLEVVPKKVKCGIEGILDPFATGLLIIAVHRFTRFLGYFSQLAKIYRAEILLGSQTDTLDSEGEVIKEQSVPILDEVTIKNALAKFIGQIEQVPPSYSNIRVDGIRAHKLARAGNEVSLPARTVSIHSIQLISFSTSRIIIECEVAAGTYIRSLARDIAIELGTVGHLTSLRRLSIGHLTVECIGDGDGKIIKDEKFVLAHIPQIKFAENECYRFRHGIKFPYSQVEDGIYRVYQKSDCATHQHFLGLAEIEDGIVKSERAMPSCL